MYDTAVMSEHPTPFDDSRMPAPTTPAEALILVVEDDSTTRKWIESTLTAAGFSCDTAERGDEGLRLASTHAHALVMVDLGLPGRTGLAIIQTLRASGHMVPIVVLTAEASDERVVSALESGADDYLLKPVSAPVLVARVRAALRRGGSRSGHVLRIGNLSFDRVARRVSVGNTDGPGDPIALTVRELELLEYLMLRGDEAVSRSELHEQVWGMRFDPGTNVVDATVSRLRTKIATHTGAPELVSVRGVGYRLVAPQA